MNDNIAIYDHLIGENIIRQATDEEQEIINQERKINTEAREKRLREVEAKAAERQAIADRLGLSSDELKILLG